MKTGVSLTVLLLIFMGCRQIEKPSININKAATIIKEKEKVNNTPVSNPVDTLSNNNWNWADSLIANYILHSDNELVKLSRGDTSIHEEWLFDSIRTIDSVKYLVYNVGHDHHDDEILVYVSDSWVFIDSLNRKLYEGQPDESLKEWKH